MSAGSKIRLYRQRLHELVDLICDYTENLPSRPAKASIKPGDVRLVLGSQPPAQAISWETIKEQLESVVFSGANHWQHPRNHGYFPCSTSFPAIMGEMVSKALNNPGFAWHVSPINTELEILMCDWVAEALGLPDFYKHASRQGGGLSHSTASESCLVALIGARNKAKGKRLVVYASEQAHFSTQKAAKILQIEHSSVPSTRCPLTGNYIMNVAWLAAMMAADKAAGKTPAMVIATFGTTASCAIDPLRAIGEITQREGVWLHVDAAYAGSALICPEFRPLIDGLELTDSFNFNGHKWLLTGFNNSLLYVKEPKYLSRSLAAGGTYLVPSKPEEIDLMAWQIPLGRDFRSIRWWMLLNQYGVEGLQTHIRKHVALARLFKERLASIPSIEVLFPVQFGLVCFALKGDDEGTRSLAVRLQERKDTIFTSGEVGGRKLLRFIVCSEYSEESNIDQAIQVIREEIQVVTQTKA